jgi:hypothetical protein
MISDVCLIMSLHSEVVYLKNDSINVGVSVCIKYKVFGVLSVYVFKSRFDLM